MTSPQTLDLTIRPMVVEDVPAVHDLDQPPIIRVEQKSCSDVGHKGLCYVHGPSGRLFSASAAPLHNVQDGLYISFRTVVVVFACDDDISSVVFQRFMPANPCRRCALFEHGVEVRFLDAAALADVQHRHNRSISGIAIAAHRHLLLRIGRDGAFDA